MEGYFLVFVYGTLRRGLQNHSLMGSAEYVGAGITADKYGLYVDENLIPYAVKDGSGVHIVGELYLVTQPILDDLDVLEGHPDWYARAEVDIRLDDGRSLKAWMYSYPEKTGQKVETGDYARWLALRSLSPPPFIAH